MKSRRPSKPLYANTVTRHATSAPLPRTRKARPRISGHARRIGIFDISSRAGLLFDLLDEINHRQKDLTFYPVETSVPMSVGRIGPSWFDDKLDEISNDTNTLSENVAFEEFLPFLEQAREAVSVDLIAGLFAPMLAFKETTETGETEFSWNLFSVGQGSQIGVSVYGVREYALAAKRPFESAVALLVLGQVWSAIYGVEFHRATRGCVFDYCENRDELIEVIRRAELCPESLEAVPSEGQSGVEICLKVIREYQR